jgi:cytochrome c oxidase subunit 2
LTKLDRGDFVQKWWSFLFGGVMVATVILWLISPFMGWWLPKNVSTYGDRVDSLFYLILAITGFFFILTEALLAYFMYAYAGAPGRREHVFGHRYAEGKVFWTSLFKTIARPVTAVIHNQHRLELTWSLVPGVILLFIAVVQIGAWEEIKYQSRMPKPGQQTQEIEVSARQFEWRVRYPSPERMDKMAEDPRWANDFGGNPHEDDVWVVNEVHVWRKNKVLVHLRTRDVIHSFYLPNLRLKQDALPGKTIPVWFEVTEPNTSKQGDRWVDGGGYKANGEPYDPAKVWELACAELCGWGHYKMVGRLYVHENRDDFLDWLRYAQNAQRLSKPPEPPMTTAAR